MHSFYSPDSNYPIETEIQDAIVLGMDEICFTDHVDYCMKKVYIAERDEVIDNQDSIYDYVGDYYKNLLYLQDKYTDKISIKIGQEFGVQKQVLNKFEKLYKSYDYDFILMSIHSINGEALWLPNFKEGRNQVDYNLQYYEELYNLVKSFKHYSVLAHLDVINRNDENEPLDFQIIKPLVAEILKQAISDGKGIELNTSSARFGVKETTPSRDILKLYKDLGGEIITVGSDTHRPGQLGVGFKENIDVLKSIGFEYICTYNKQKPIFHNLK